MTLLNWSQEMCTFFSLLCCLAVCKCSTNAIVSAYLLHTKFYILLFKVVTIIYKDTNSTCIDSHRDLVIREFHCKTIK